MQVDCEEGFRAPERFFGGGTIGRTRLLLLRRAIEPRATGRAFPDDLDLTRWLALGQNHGILGGLDWT
jgi:hypothetical protein